MATRGASMTAAGALACFALAACTPARYSAEYDVPGAVVGVELKQTSPPLADYDRVLFFGPPGGPFERIEISPDDGGFALVNLYRLDAADYLVSPNGVGDHVYRLGFSSPGITDVFLPYPIVQRVPSGAQFLGAFDFDDAYNWRFFPAAVRAEREVGKPYPNHG